jgi:hypothetical protein
MGSQEKEINCACGLIAKRVYTVPQISVDNTDKIDYTVSAGRNFSNKRDLEAWMREKNVHVMDDSYLSKEREEIAEEQDLRLSLASKGIDYYEYLKDQQASKTRQQDELLKKLGVKVEQVESSEYLGAGPMDGWVDTVEDKYLGATHTDCYNQAITKMADNVDRVECPYSELTGGAVSNV